MNSHPWRTSLAILIALSGCIDEKKGTAPPPPTPQSAGAEAQARVISAVQQMDSSLPTPQDAQPSVPMVFQLVCYQIAVPVGKVSRNEAFWKRIDETSLDPARYDVLRRNGMRLGIAPVDEFEGIRALLEDARIPAKVMGTVAPDARNMELPMRKSIEFQTVSYYGDNNELTIRNFDRCENIFNLSFRRTPRRLGDMRLTLAPMVRSKKKRLEFTAMNDEIEITYVAPVKFYLNIDVDLPMDKFLVLGPSDNAELPTIIGHQFFVKDDPAQQMEQVLIFVAQPYRLEIKRQEPQE